ncbi:MAG: PHP domain-containing protein [Megasphaera sp.]|nr:PHP domain-containing protein [Megasphaera sp.]MCH4187957.1 PHP domain-containing protein [Megasphaera sp.]MCH4217677.1 PHP domain-containing protein [Megasphaera sp.]
METWLDLHMHTKYSMDGEFEPENLMEQCAAAGLKAVAVSDHDGVSAVPAARKRAIELGLHFLPAIEISCQHEGKNFHLLGYGIHDQAEVFHQIEEDLKQQRYHNAEIMMDRIEALGIQLDRPYVWSLAASGTAAAVHMAQAALENPANADNELLAPYRPGGPRSNGPYVNFGWDFCGQDKPCYVPLQVMDFRQAVQDIQHNGGVAILAHPGANMGCNAEMTDELLRTGLDGIEAYCSYHDEHTAGFYAAICKEKGLICTVGSDYHGKSKPNIQLGHYGHPDPQVPWEALTALIDSRGGEVY